MRVGYEMQIRRYVRVTTGIEVPGVPVFRAPILMAKLCIGRASP